MGIQLREAALNFLIVLDELFWRAFCDTVDVHPN